MPISLPPSLRWCPSCHRDVAEFRPGPSGRPDATCPHCGAHERHRFLSLLLDGLAPWLSAATAVLDVAPSRQMSRRMRRLCPRGYVSLDFDPAADDRRVDVRASLTALPLPDDSVDLVLCYHVLEHVPDDRAAMREIARVLKPGGMGLLQVPWRGGVETDEDPAASTEERVRRFGQADHVRYYGRDFDDRLVEAGLDVTRLSPAGTVGRVGCDLMRLVPAEAVWAVRPSTADSSWRRVEGLAGASGAYLARLVAEGRARERRHAGALASARERERLASQREASLAAASRTAERSDERARADARRAAARVSALEEEVRRSRAEAERWRRGYEKLRGRLPVRVLAAGGRGLRRVAELRR